MSESSENGQIPGRVVIGGEIDANGVSAGCGDDPFALGVGRRRRRVTRRRYQHVLDVVGQRQTVAAAHAHLFERQLEALNRHKQKKIDINRRNQSNNLSIALCLLFYYYLNI